MRSGPVDKVMKDELGVTSWQTATLPTESDPLLPRWRPPFKAAPPDGTKLGSQLKAAEGLRKDTSFSVKDMTTLIQNH